MPALNRQLRTTHLAPLVTAVGLTLIILGPALRPGVAIAYDMAWSPVPRWTPFVLGIDTPAPRAVPSDAVAVFVGSILGAGLAQKVILSFILVLAGVGAAALLRELVPASGAVATSAATVAAIWNPFVAERLVIGQWTILLGYACLPWLCRSLLRLADHRGTLWSPAGWIVVASFGGANALVIAALGLVIVVGTRQQWRNALILLGVWVGSAAAWAIPGLVGEAVRTTSGVMEFRPRADTPFGVAVSLLSGGGIWNPAAHQDPRGHWFVALVATVLATVVAALAIRQFWARTTRPVVVMGALGLTAALVSAVPFLASAWSAVVTALPGGGLLRDSQKLVAPWMLLLALGAGLLVERLRAPGRQWGAAVAVAVMVLPVVILPTLAWGVGGRVQAVQVPADYLRAAEKISSLPVGVVGLLPWNQYRRYEWNDSRVSLSIAPRIVDQPVLFDDSLPLATGIVAGEDPRAARVTARIQAGIDPAEALLEEEVSYLVIEGHAGEDVSVPQDAGEVLVATSALTVIQVGENPSLGAQPTDAALAGWVTTLATWTAVLLGAAYRKAARRPREV